jgi:hypothetical protein
MPNSQRAYGTHPRSAAPRQPISTSTHGTSSATLLLIVSPLIRCQSLIGPLRSSMLVVWIVLEWTLQPAVARLVLADRRVTDHRVGRMRIRRLHQRARCGSIDVDIARVIRRQILSVVPLVRVRLAAARVMLDVMLLPVIDVVTRGVILVIVVVIIVIVLR